MYSLIIILSMGKGRKTGFAPFANNTQSIPYTKYIWTVSITKGVLDFV